MNGLTVLLLAALGVFAGDLPQRAAIGDTGPYSRLVAHGSYVYVATFSGIRVYDVSDPDLPVETTYLDTDSGALDLVVKGSYLLVADATRLVVYDITTPASPVQVTTWTPSRPPGNINLMRLAGDTLFLVDLQYVYAVNVSDPTNPVELDDYDAGATVFSMAVDGNRAYVTQAGGQVHVVAVDNPADLQQLSSFVPGFSPLGIAADGNTLYIGDLSTLALAVWDLSGTPMEVGRLGLAGVPLWDFHKAGDQLYIPINSGGLAIVDVATASAPTLTGTVPADDLTRHVAVAGNNAFVAEFLAGMRVVDVTDPSMPSTRAAVGSGNVADRFAREGDLGFFVNFGPAGSKVLDLMDLSNDAAPVLLGSYAAAQIVDVQPAGTLVYVAENTNGIRVLDISNPAAPTVVHTVPGTFTGLDAANGLLYAAGDNFVYAFDLSTPTQPTQLVQFMLNRPRDIKMVGTTAYVADRTRGLVVLDMSTPSAPVILGEQTTQTTGSQIVRVFEGYAFLPNGGLNVMDIADPGNPVLVAFHVGNFADAAFSEGLLYVAESVAGLTVYDMDGATLTPVGVVDTPGNSSVLTWEPGRLTLSDSVGGRHYIFADTLRFERLRARWPARDVRTLGAHITGQGTLPTLRLGDQRAPKR